MLQQLKRLSICRGKLVFVLYREERIDQELKRLKAVQEAAQCRAEAQASRRLIEHQKSIARVS